MIAELLNAVCRDTSPTADVVIGLSADEVLNLLGNRHRRVTVRQLAALSRRDGAVKRPVGVDDLVDAVAAAEYDVPVGETTHEQEWTAAAALHQTHLPALEDASVVEIHEKHVVPSRDIDELVDLLAVFETACEFSEEER